MKPILIIVITIVLFFLIVENLETVYAQDSPLNDVTNQLENQINQDNLKELDKKVTSLDNKISTLNDQLVSKNAKINERLDKIETTLISDTEWDSLADFFTIAGSVATAALVFIIYLQTKKLGEQTSEMEKTNELAHTPCIIPRQDQSSGKTYIVYVENIGTSSAKKVNLNITSSIESKRVFPIALVPGQRFPNPGNPPLVECNAGDSITVKGSYQNIRGETIDVNDTYELSALVQGGTSP